jgi:hypothetical protein
VGVVLLGGVLVVPVLVVAMVMARVAVVVIVVVLAALASGQTEEQGRQEQQGQPAAECSWEGCAGDFGRAEQAPGLGLWRRAARTDSAAGGRRPKGICQALGCRFSATSVE